MSPWTRRGGLLQALGLDKLNVNSLLGKVTFFLCNVKGAVRGSGLVCNLDRIQDGVAKRHPQDVIPIISIIINNSASFIDISSRSYQRYII